MLHSFKKLCKHTPVWNLCLFKTDEVVSVNCSYTPWSQGFPGGAGGKEPACQCRRCKRRGFDLWIRKIPWRRVWQPTPASLPGEARGQRSLAGYSPWGGEVGHDWVTELLLHPLHPSPCFQYSLVSFYSPLIDSPSHSLENLLQTFYNSAIMPLNM